jgi:hypothetical protein
MPALALSSFASDWKSEYTTGHGSIVMIITTIIAIRALIRVKPW